MILDRLAGGGIPVLDSHQQIGIENSIGRLQTAWIERGALIGKIAFHDTPRGRAAEGMIARNEVRGISAGYRVEEWLIEDEDGNVIDPEQDIIRWDDDLTFTAVRWELLECSLVSVPADADAAVRSLSGNAPQFIRNTRAQMEARQNMIDRIIFGSTTRNIRTRMEMRQRMIDRKT